MCVSVFLCVRLCVAVCEDRTKRSPFLTTPPPPRWTAKADELAKKFSNVYGDSLLSAAAVVYLGPLSRQYRDTAMENWCRILDEARVLRSLEATCTDLLSDVVARRSWVANGLPSDTFSLEGASFVTKSTCWPLIIDPQVMPCSCFPSYPRQRVHTHTRTRYAIHWSKSK